MANIVEFLTARLDEDEQLAKAAAVKAAGSPVYGSPDSTGKWRATNDGVFADTEYTNSPFVVDGYGFLADEIGAHIARHDPAHVLTEVTAKRLLLVMYERCVRDVDARPPVFGSASQMQILWHLVRAAAAVYDQHPDFNPAWRVE